MRSTAATAAAAAEAAAAEREFTAVMSSDVAADEEIGKDTNALRRVGVMFEEHCSNGGSSGRGGSGRERIYGGHLL